MPMMPIIHRAVVRFGDDGGVGAVGKIPIFVTCGTNGTSA
jgi:hypothetical protein